MINLLLLILIRFDGIEIDFDTFEYDYTNGVIIITTHIFRSGFEL
jgi:hypothetical protein